jgi:hypothetical protein
MTREQGYRIIYLIFEAEDVSAGQIYYGPAQKMIHFIPVHVDQAGLDHEPFFCLGELLGWGFINNFGEGETLWADSVDEKDRDSNLTSSFDILLYTFESEIGKHILLNALAHNEVIKSIFQNRIDLWNDFITTYMNTQKIPKKYSSPSILRWPSTGKATMIDDESDYMSWYECEYRNEYRALKERLFKSLIDDAGQIKLIAQRIKNCFEVEKKITQTRIQAIKVLASPFEFDGTSTWEPYKDPSLESFIDKLEKDMTQLKSTTKAIHQQSLHIPKISMSLDGLQNSTRDEFHKLSQLLSDPEPIQFRLGIECGALEKGDEDDPRYRILGPVQTSLRTWLNYLYNHGIKVKDLPTSSTIRGKLRRTINFHSNMELEDKTIATALDRVKMEF